MCQQLREPNGRLTVTCSTCQEIVHTFTCGGCCRRCAQKLCNVCADTHGCRGGEPDGQPREVGSATASSVQAAFSPLGSGVFGFVGTVLGAGQVGVTDVFRGAGACRGTCILAKGGRDVLVSAVVGRALHGVGFRRRRPTRGAAGSQCHGRPASCAARLSNIGPPLIFRCGLAFGSWPAWHRRCRSPISPHRSTIMTSLGSNKVAVGQRKQQGDCS